MLYIVGTPIGNLQDMTLRALETLKNVDFIICEDTRVTAKLLNAFGIKKPLKSWHHHSTPAQTKQIIDLLLDGHSAAYVSDAGTPGVNDPGGKLVSEAHKNNLAIALIPGVSAMTGVISVCGFPMEKFVYMGYAPHKKGRETFFKEAADRDEATIFFESTHRIMKALALLKKFLPAERMVFVGRELTKMHETLTRGEINAIIESISSQSTKGEFTIVIAPKNYHE